MKPMLMEVVRWQNGIVMCFDQNGEQMPDLQGPYEEVRANVLNAAHASTRFRHGVWPGAGVGESGGLDEVKREEW